MVVVYGGGIAIRKKENKKKTQFSAHLLQRKLDNRRLYFGEQLRWDSRLIAAHTIPLSEAPHITWGKQKRREHA